MLSTCQLYLRLRAMLSRNSSLFKTYPYQDGGGVVSQLDARGGVRGHKTRGQGQGTQKKFRGQGQTLSRPRRRIKDTDASVLQKKVLKIFFSGDLKKKVFKIFFQAKKVFKNFFQAIYLRKPKKKVFADFPQGFLALFNKILTVQK